MLSGGNLSERYLCLRGISAVQHDFSQAIAFNLYPVVFPRFCCRGLGRRADWPGRVWFALSEDRMQVCHRRQTLGFGIFGDRRTGIVKIRVGLDRNAAGRPRR